MAREPDTITRLRRALGERLATFRQAAGLSQAQLTDRVYVDRTTIAHVERGRSRGNTQFWQAADAVVRADGALVRGYAEVVAARHTHDAHVRDTALAEVRAQAEALRGTETASLEHDRAVTRRGLAGYVAAEALGFRGSDESAEISAIRAMSEAFQLADRKLGGGILYGQIVRYIRGEIAPALLDPASGIPASELFSAAASFAEIAGWMAHDGGHNGKARAHFGQAYHLAAAARNPVLSANICASIAHLAIQLDQAGDAIRIATTGISRAAQGSGATHLVARLYAMRARALALQQNEKECRRSLAAAHYALTHDDNGAAAGWIADFDRASLAAESALCLYTLGALAEAEAEARTVIALRDGDRVRSRALGQLTLAHILRKAGHIDEAAAIGSDVCAVAPALDSARVHAGLDALSGALNNHQATPAVRSFVDSFAALRQQPATRTELRWPL